MTERSSTERASGRLFVVATPIGNLEDITLRALRVLRECDAILAEDTRRTRVLCQHHAIGTPLRSFHAHSPDAKTIAIAEELAGGARLALVTDAGTPLVSDPGANLVQAAAERGVAIEPVPGPSAPLTALMGAGLRVWSFRFLGFLPRAGGRRKRLLTAIAGSIDATVLFEAPNRVPATLADLRDVVGADRRAALCRELTKLHEQFARGSLSELAEQFSEPVRGEVTIVVEGLDEREDAPADAAIDPDVLARELIARGGKTKDAAREMAERTGLSVREAYARLLALSQAPE